MRTNAIFYLTLALCAGVVSACVDENINSDKDVNGKAIKFGLSSQKTKTVYDDKDSYQINWVNGDQITIFCAEAESAKSALYNVTPASTAKDGTITNAGSDVLQWGGDGLKHHFYAVYPGNTANGNTANVDENGIATFSINRNQKCTVTTTDGFNNNVVAKPDMKNANMVAYTATEPTDEPVSLSFKPLMTTLEIVVTGPTTNINSSNARVTGVSIVSTIKTTSSESGDSFKYDIVKGVITGSGNTGAETTKSETTFISLVDDKGNATYVDLANGHTLTLTAFLPPMSEAQAAAMKRQVKVRVHITGNAELTASVKTNTDTDPWTTQIAPSTKKKITLPAIPSGQQSSGNNWITPLDDNIYVCQMSIPGTHDAGTGHGMDVGGSGALAKLGEAFLGSLISSAGQTQDYTILQQINMGIRAFDLRPAYTTNNQNRFDIWHGVIKTQLSLSDALKQMTDYLDINPGEFFIIWMRHESETAKFFGVNLTYKNTSKWSTDFGQTVIDNVGDKLIAFKPDLTIGEMRGKILFLTRDEYSNRIGGLVSPFSSGSSSDDGAISNNGTSASLYYQDVYSGLNETNKVGYVKELLDKSAKFHTDGINTLTWVVNHTSGYTGSTSTTNAYRENAANTNKPVYDYLTGSEKEIGSTGIMFMDYVGIHESGNYTVYGDLLPQTIIDNNYKYRMRRKGE